jgi:hypothetical protein
MKEQAKSSSNNSGDAVSNHLRKGKSGDWRNHFNRELVIS